MRSDFNTGYSYVDATFRSTFYTVSPHNSSADLDPGTPFPPRSCGAIGRPCRRRPLAPIAALAPIQMIRIDPGACLPGIPLATVYSRRCWPGMRRAPVTAGVSRSLPASLAYVRGNENNLRVRAAPIGRSASTS